jgi:hypothetical protein
VPIDVVRVPDRLVAVPLPGPVQAAGARRVRRLRQAALSELVGDFVARNLPCLVGEVPDDSRPVLPVPVPSSSAPRPSWEGEHPLVALLGAALAAQPLVHLASAVATGLRPTRHLRADRASLRPVAPVAGRRVVVFDDTYTSGARAQRVAAVLSDAGAEVAAIVPIGRPVHPAHSTATGELWGRRAREPFDPLRCAGPCLLSVP